MSNEKETISIQIPESFTFGNCDADHFDKFLSFFDWSLKNRKVEIDFREVLDFDYCCLALIVCYQNFLFKENCQIIHLLENQKPRILTEIIKETDWKHLANIINLLPKESNPSLILKNSEDCKKALEFCEKFIGNIDVEYDITFRYIISELIYNTLEHGRNGHNIPSLFQLFWNNELNELSFIVVDVGVGIKKHLRQTYPNLATDCEAILYSIKPEISGTFGQSKTGYETKDNAGVGLYFSSNYVQKLKADMFIVSGNGFVHISPKGIISKELQNTWKGTFVYVKVKIGLVKNFNFQKMKSEIEGAIEKPDKPKDYYIQVKNYFGNSAEDKDLAKKIRDKYILPALSENKSLIIDFEDIVFAPHSLLNAMLATPIQNLGLSAYLKIRIINAAPEIRETLDFIFRQTLENDKR